MKRTANTLELILNRNDWKQKDLATKAKLSHTLISRLINHGKMLSLDNFRSILASLSQKEDFEALALAILHDLSERLGIEPQGVYYSDSLKSHNIQPDEIGWLSQVATATRKNPQFKKTIDTTLEMLSMTEDQYRKMVAESKVSYESINSD